MFRNRSTSRRFGDDLSRRGFLRIGVLAACGLSSPLSRGSERLPPSFGKARRCLLVFLTGGPPQHDTWDPKPDAPERIRGEFRPIATNVPGIQFSELFPRLAQNADKLCVVRSVTHGDRIHTSAGYTMLTGVPHPLANSPSAANVRPNPDDHPHLGSLLTLARPSRRPVPPFVSMPEVPLDGGVNKYPGLDGGMLGRSFAPFWVEANAELDGFPMPDLLLPTNIAADRHAHRRLLLEEFEHGNRVAERQAGQDMDGWYRRAYEALGSPAFREALALDREPAQVRERYGHHILGQGCLLARRLLEAGVGMAAVYWHNDGSGNSMAWDTHEDNFGVLRNRLVPPTDAALAALLEDLDQRGMLDDTLVLCMGEFGRSPLVNRNAGRDHWSTVQSMLAAGGGVRRGCTFGASDRIGGEPVDRPVSPADLIATWMHLLGMPADLEIRTRAGRPLQACSGSIVRGLMT